VNPALARFVVVLLAAAFAAVHGIATAAVAAQAIEANRVTELTFTSSKPHADPFNELEVDVLFTSPNGQIERVPAFWAGEDRWRARFSSPTPGPHAFATSCSDSGDLGLQGIKGVVTVTPYTGDNPLYRHGPIRVASDKKHFEHLDGTPFFWLGDTWWMGLTDRLHWPEEFATLTSDRVGKGFTVVQIVAGLYPDMPAFDPRGANEAGFPWEKDYARINPAYFDAADRRIAYLIDHGIAPCVVGAWGYHIPWLGVGRMKKHWRYLIARWGAYPGIFWCTAGEGAMPYYLSADKAKDADLQRHALSELVNYIHATDPYHHPVSIHPTDLSRTQLTDPSVLDFEMLQTGHGDRASIGPTIDFVRRSREAKPAMPTINSEVCYEGILGTCHADVVRIVTWGSLLGGTAGHTYGANGIWQMNRKDQPYGKSPHGGTYGPTPWDEAMKLPGSTQVGYAKKLLERFEWWKFQPHPEWAAWADSPRVDAVKWGDWMWDASDGNAAHDAPPGKPRRFERTIRIPAEATIGRATLYVSADDRFIAFLDHTKLGASDNRPESWRRPQRFDLKPLLSPGRDFVIRVDAENVAANVPNNPAGVICGGEVVLGDGARIPLASGEQWTCPGDARDHHPIKAQVIAHYGEGPWGAFASASRSPDPISAGIPGSVCVVYLAKPSPVRVSGLDRDAKWEAMFFDPTTGQDAPLSPPAIDASGSATIAPPPAANGDWVLVLQRSAAR
jgi:Protein of unknown function (DUF4038)/Domain of unknown function (DUF5060)